MQKHNTESKTIGEIQQKNTTEKHNRKTQHRKIAENEDRAHNNHIDTDRIRNTILIFPVFCPQRHEKIHGEGNTHKGRENLSEGKKMGKLELLWGRIEKKIKKNCSEK